MRPSPNDDVNIMKARARYFSPQGLTSVAHQPACFIACDTSFLHDKGSNGLSMLHDVLLSSLIYVLYVFIGPNGLSM